MPIARRGEIWQVDLGMAAKVRPALILSVAFLDHERALFAIVPHATALRGTRFESVFPFPECKQVHSMLKAFALYPRRHSIESSAC